MRWINIGWISLFILSFFIPLVTAQSDSLWEQVVPVMSFGYGELQSVYWSPINGQLAAVSSTGFQFYDAEMTLEGERRFEDANGGAALFSPDMRYVALDEAGGLVIRDTSSWQPILAITAYQSPSWSPDSQWLAVWTGDHLQIWDVAAATVTLEVMELVSNGGAVQWSPDSAVIAVPGPGAIVMIKTDTGDIVRIHPFAEIASFDWSKDGQWLAVVGLKEPLPLDFDRNKTPVVYDLMKVDALSGEVVQRFDIDAGYSFADWRYSAVGRVQISPNGLYIAAQLQAYRPYNEDRWESLNVGMSLWNFATAQPLTEMNTSYPPMNIRYVSWSPDGTSFATSEQYTLMIYDARNGSLVNQLTAYISSTTTTLFNNDGLRVVAAGGLWDVSTNIPVYLRPDSRTFMPDAHYQETYYDDYAPDGLEFLQPDPAYFDYGQPPYEWRVLQVYPDRQLVITYEQDIEYSGTPEYEDEEPPEERYVIWDMVTQARIEEDINIGEQTAWLYDLEGAAERRAEDGNTAWNVLRYMRFLSIGDDQIVDLRNQETVWYKGTNRWEWREVWFSPDGKRVMTYDTDQRFKAIDVNTGDTLYQTVPAPREGIGYTRDLSVMSVIDHNSTLYLYNAETGEQLLEAFTGNRNPLLLWNEDRSLLAIGGENRGVVLYDMHTQQRLAVLRGHQQTITSMGWNPACDYTQMQTCRYVFASSDASGQVILWGFRGSEQAALNVPENPAAPSLELPAAAVEYRSLDPLWVYVAEGQAYGRNAAQFVEWAESGISVNNEWFYNTDFVAYTSPPEDEWYTPEEKLGNGLTLLTDGDLINSQGEVLAHAGRDIVYDTAFSPDGSILTAEATGTELQMNGWVREWSVPSGQYMGYWGGGNPAFNQIATSPDGKWIATSTVDYYQAGGRGQIWFADRENVQFSSLIGHQDTITALFWYGENVITSSLDGTVRLWDIRTGLQLARWNHPDHAPINQMEWTPDGKLLLSAGDDLCTLDPNLLQEIDVYEGVGGRGFDWSPDQKQVVTIGSDSVVRLMAYPSGQVLKEERSHMQPITHMDWKPDGSVLAVARSDGSLILLDALTGRVTSILRMYGRPIRNIVWSPDGRQLLLDIKGEPLQIINGQSGAVMTEIDNPWRRIGAWWSPDGTKIAFGTYPDPEVDVYNAPALVEVYQVATGTLVQAFNLQWGDYSWYERVKPFEIAWSQDSTQLAAFYDGRARLWHLPTGTMIENRYAEDDTTISLVVWNNSSLDIWTPYGQWVWDTPNNNLYQISKTGQPENTLIRADQKVLLAGQKIVDFATNYPLQQLPYGYISAAWHPTCMTTDCPVLLAAANGSNIIMYGYETQGDQ